MNDPQIAILILNWNNFPDTRKCLDSLDNLKYRNYRVILVDNGSDDGSRERLEAAFPGLTILASDRNLGFAGGNNIGLRHILDSRIPYTLLLNNDTEVIQPDFLDRIVEEIQKDPRICAIGPKVLQLDGTPDQVIIPFPTLDKTLRTTLGTFEQQLDRKQKVDSLIGCCVLVRNEAIRQVGPLDENYFMYVEETEWFYRMRKEGWQIIYYPVESVVHKGGSSAEKLERADVYVERRANVIYTLVKHRFMLQAFLTAGFMAMMLSYRLMVGTAAPDGGRERIYPASIFPQLISAISRKWKLAAQARD